MAPKSHRQECKGLYFFQSWVNLIFYCRTKQTLLMDTQETKNRSLNFRLSRLCSLSSSNNIASKHHSGIIDPSGLSVMWSFRVGQRNALPPRLLTPAAQTERGLEVKWYPRQTGVYVRANAPEGSSFKACGHPSPSSAEIQPNLR